MEKMLYDTHEKPSIGKWFLLSFQHVFAMFGATILVPMLTGLPVSVALFTSGVGTLIYILCTKAKVPVYLGSSFAYIGAICAAAGYNPETGIAANGYGAAMTGILAVGVIYIIVALIIKFVGKKWIDVAFPPIIIGSMIMVIGFGLSSTAISSSGLVSGGNYKDILIAFVSLAIVIVCSMYLKGFFKVIPFLIGILGGYIFAIILGRVDFTNFVETIKDPSQWFKIPEFMFLSYKDSQANVLGTQITFHKINAAALLTVIPLAFVTICEHIGDHAVLGKITGKDYLHDPGLDRTLLGDGIATSFAALFGGPANTTYGENTSVVGLTRVGSVWVTGGAAVIAIVLSFFNVFVELINTIPGSVMGGICIILYGFIGINGLKVIIDKKVDMSKIKNLVIMSAILVIGLGGAVIDFAVGNQTLSLEKMGIAAIVGIILNFALPEKKNKKEDKEEKVEIEVKEDAEVKEEVK